MVVVRLRVLAVAVMALSGLVAGCAGPSMMPARRCVRLGSNLIFNPEWTGLGPSDAARRPWPVAVAGENWAEVQDYRIHFRDTFRWSSSGRFDDVYRRVDDVRAGRSSR